MMSNQKLLYPNHLARIKQSCPVLLLDGKTAFRLCGTASDLDVLFETDDRSKRALTEMLFLVLLIYAYLDRSQKNDPLGWSSDLMKHSSLCR